MGALWRRLYPIPTPDPPLEAEGEFFPVEIKYDHGRSNFEMLSCKITLPKKLTVSLPRPLPFKGRDRVGMGISAVGC